MQQTLETEVIRSTELLHCSQDIIFSDGSKKDVPQLVSVTDAGVYRPAESVKLVLKHPAKQGMLNTITRAELIAILATVRFVQYLLAVSVAWPGNWKAG